MPGLFVGEQRNRNLIDIFELVHILAAKPAAL
jgi:hypothetical protein